MRRVLPSSFWLASMAIATRLFAQQEGESVRLEYTADAGCPGRAAFVAEVEARTPRARFDEHAPGARTITVGAHITEGRAQGTIDVGWGARREISAESCADVVSALALVTALVIDPDALVAPLAPEGTSPASPPAATPTANTAPVATPTPATIDAATPEPTTAALTTSDQPPSAAASAPWKAASPLWGAGARFDASIGLAGQGIAMFGPSAWFEGGVRLSRLFVPTLRLVGRAAFSPTITPRQGSAHFRLLTGQLDACPLRYEVGRVALVPCVSVELGALQATADSAPPMVTPRSATSTWMAVDQSIAVELATGGPVYLAFVAQLREPVSGYDFVFGTSPDIPIASVHGVELATSVGAGLRFW